MNFTMIINNKLFFTTLNKNLISTYYKNILAVRKPYYMRCNFVYEKNIFQRVFFG